MIKIYDIYVKNTGSILLLIDIHWCSGNSQHSMVSHVYCSNMTIEDYKWKILLTFMLALHAFVTSSFTLLYGEVIAKIQCYISTNKTQFYKTNPRNIANIFFAYLVHLYSFGAWCIYQRYSRNDMSSFPILYSTKKIKISEIYFCIGFVSNVFMDDISDMKCQIHKFTVGSLFCLLKKWSKFPTFMIALLFWIWLLCFLYN